MSMDAHEHSRRACYFSMEFLVGRAVYNNLLVLDVMQDRRTLGLFRTDQ
mgnify:CR=1 FL=1